MNAAHQNNQLIIMAPTAGSTENLRKGGDEDTEGVEIER
jgi:hypothetical protein